MITRRNVLALGGMLAGCSGGRERPNVLWLTCEDTGPHLGCYGDRYADTPNVDALARRALRYENAWSNAPVCAPARTTIISGLYPPSTGSEHMRSMTSLPANFRMFPSYLREAGYYCTNNVKEDYNLAHTGQVWDESSKNAHYRNRKPGQPFFAVFNNTVTHESQIRRRPHTLRHDPSRARIPAYHPDTPEVRHDWAQYYDNITTMDTWVGEQLTELEKAGLAQDTIVFFYGDHGSGMPRSKRWPYNSGLHVPLLVHIPDRFKNLQPAGYQAGGATRRLVSFVDLAPTVLSLAGIQAPEYYQGHAFLGRHTAPDQPFVFGFRGRMDERYDMVRSVRNERYVYVRNYMPHRIYGQHVSYMFETPTTQVWQKLHREGKLNAAQDAFWNEKPPEELYDLQADPDETRNLAGDPAHGQPLETMRQAQHQLAARIRDVGFLPEGDIHERSKGRTPYEMGHDPAAYPFERIAAMAEYAASEDAETEPLQKGLGDADPAVRYWAAAGLLRRKNAASLRNTLQDSSPYVRIVAGECLGRFGSAAERKQATAVLLGLAAADKNGMFVSLAALNALETFPVDNAALAVIRKLPDDDTTVAARFRGYVPRMLARFRNVQ